MKTVQILFVAVIAIIFFSSNEIIKEADSSDARNLMLPAFTSVEKNYNIDVVVSFSNSKEMVKMGYENLLNIFNIKVEKETSKLNNKKDNYKICNINLKATFKIPFLTKIVIWQW